MHVQFQNRHHGHERLPRLHHVGSGRGRPAHGAARVDDDVHGGQPVRGQAGGDMLAESAE